MYYPLRVDFKSFSLMNRLKGGNSVYGTLQKSVGDKVNDIYFVVNQHKCG